MIASSLSIFLPALSSGFLLVQLIWPVKGWWALFLKLSLGIGLGLGMASCLYFFQLIILPGQQGYFFISLAAIVIFLFGLFIKNRWPWQNLGRPALPSPFQFALLAIVFLAVFSALFYFFTHALLSSHGDFDAQMIWNMRARFIYRLADNWPLALSSNIDPDFHLDYPMLIPLNIVGGWNSIGYEQIRVPMAQALLFAFGAAAVLFFGLGYLRSLGLASLALIILLASPLWLLISTFQTADIPLAYYFLSALLLLYITIREQNRAVLGLTGLAAGLAGWTKNEGLVFMLLVAGVILFKFYSQRSFLLAFFGGLAFPLVTILTFKLMFPIANDILAGNLSSTPLLARVLDGSRYSLIFESLFRQLSHLFGWPMHLNIVVLLGLFLLIWRRPQALEEQASFKSAVWVVILQLIAYIGVYVLSPHDLSWHLTYSLERLLLQLFPMALLLIFLSEDIPEKVLMSK